MTLTTTFFALCFAAVLGSTSTSAQESCILTDTSCQCAVSKPSGSCVRSQGDGKCVLGECSQGYRCDCFGYEVCSVKTCGKHVAVGVGIMSETKSFACMMEPGAGTCTDPVGYADTIEASNNAAADATVSVEESNIAASSALIEASDITDDKKAIMQILKDVDRVSVDIPDNDLSELETETVAVLRALEDGTGSLVRCTEKSRKAIEKLNEARKYKREAAKKEKEIKVSEEKIKVIKQKIEKQGADAINKTGVSREDRKEMDRVQAEISTLTAERKESVKMCGNSAKQANDYKTESNKELENTRQLKETARAARDRLTVKSQSLMEKARQTPGLMRSRI